MATQDLGDPPRDPGELTGGPHKFLSGAFYRIAQGHRSSPWYFNPSGDCRFDLVLVAGMGTCYVGSDLVAAILETLSDDYGDIVEVAWFEDRVGWLVVADPAKANDPPVSDLFNDYWTRFHLTAELWADATLYAICHRWAAAFQSAGFSGMWHGVRHALASDHATLSLFGAEGPRPDDPRFVHQESIPLDSTRRNEFAAATGINVEGSPVSRALLNVMGT